MQFTGLCFSKIGSNIVGERVLTEVSLKYMPNGVLTSVGEQTTINLAIENGKFDGDAQILDRNGNIMQTIPISGTTAEINMPSEASEIKFTVKGYMDESIMTTLTIKDTTHNLEIAKNWYDDHYW